MIDMSGIKAKLQRMPAEIEMATIAYGETVSADLQGQAQRNRPWHDRTGQARQRLRGYVERPNNHTVRINLAHGVDYGEKLEFGYEKKYAIIQPTLQRNAPKVVSGWWKMVKKL